MIDKVFKKSVQELKPYTITAFDVWQKDDEYLKLDWNESTIKPSKKVINAILDIINNNNINWYPPTVNNRLLENLSEYNQIDKRYIQYFAGSDNLQEYIITSSINVGDNVIIISPTYDNFRAAVEGQGGKIHFFDLDSNFKLNVSDLLKSIKLVRPKFVYLCNPNNPTGNTYDFNFCENLIKRNPDIFFVIDEAYYEFCEITLTKLVTKYSNFVITRTFSKAFGLASFRIGYALANSKVIEMINRIRNPKSIPLLSQVAAVNALEDIDYMNKYVEEVEKSKNLLIECLNKNKISFVSGKGNFIMIKPHSKNLLNKEFLNCNILVRDLSHIKRLEDYLRITIGTSAQMKKVISVIDKL